MQEHSYQNDATAKQAIVGKNKQIFTLKENHIYAQLDIDFMYREDIDNRDEIYNETYNCRTLESSRFEPYNLSSGSNGIGPSTGASFSFSLETKDKN
jgi:hypothetical protein